MNNEQQTQQADDPSGDRYWRNVLPSEILQPDDMMRTMAGLWLRTTVPGKFARDGCGRTYRRRIEPQPEAQPQPQPEPQATQDDPSGPGWRDVEVGEVLQPNDMMRTTTGLWLRTTMPGRLAPSALRYRRRIEPQQPSDSEPETMEDLRERLNAALKSNNERGDLVQRQHDLLREAEERNEKLVRQVELTQQENGELQGLVSQAERSGEQVNAELQQLREQVTMLTRERDRYRNQLSGAIEHSKAPEAQAKLVDRLQRWLRPVLEVVSDHPDHTSILAVSVLEFLPQIASRLIEE